MHEFVFPEQPTVIPCNLQRVLPLLGLLLVVRFDFIAANFLLQFSGFPQGRFYVISTKHLLLFLLDDDVPTGSLVVVLRELIGKTVDSINVMA